MGTLVNITCLLCGYRIKILARIVFVMGRFNPGHGGLCFYPSPTQTQPKINYDVLGVV